MSTQRRKVVIHKSNTANRHNKQRFRHIFALLTLKVAFILVEDFPDKDILVQYLSQNMQIGEKTQICFLRLLESRLEATGSPVAGSRGPVNQKLQSRWIVIKFTNSVQIHTGKLEYNKAYIINLQNEYDEEAFDTYRASMPWPAVPFRDARRASLQMGLGVKSIPALIVIDENGVVLTGSGVTPITKNATLVELFENKNEVKDLSGSAVEIIQRPPVCIALTDQSDGVAKANPKEIMQTMTDDFSSNPTMTPRSPREDTVFCILQENDKLAQAIRSLCNFSLEKKKWIWQVGNNSM